MLKNNTAFAPEIDQKNRDKKPEIKERTPKDKNRRYQDYDSKAPVSRRQHIKRNGRKVPIVITTLNAGSLFLLL